MTFLIDGRVPAHTPCKWRSKCEIAEADKCKHRGEQHEVPFSCASARGFEMLESGATHWRFRSLQKKPL